MKTTYTVYKNGEFEKDSVYHFDRTTPEVASLAALELVKNKTDCVPASGSQDKDQGEGY